MSQKRRSDCGEGQKGLGQASPRSHNHEEVCVGSEAGQDVNRPPSSTTKGSEAKASTSCIRTLFHRAGIATSSVPASVISNTNPAVKEGSQTIGSLRSIGGQLCWRAKLERAGLTLGNRGPNDRAHAVATGAVLVTNDKAFAQVEDLGASVNWATDL